MPVMKPFDIRTQQAEQYIRDNNITKLPIDPIAIAENEGIVVRAMPPENRGVSGMLLKNGNNFGIAYATHIDNQGFQNFSVGHELGHYLIPGHCDHLIPMGSGQHESRAGFTSKDKYEMEADYFAAGLLMPRPLFTREMSKVGYGLNAVDILSVLCVTSMTATAIRYAQLADIPTATVISTGKSINYAFMSESLKEIRGIEWLRKGTTLPRKCETGVFNCNVMNVANAKRASGEVLLQDWFEGPKDIVMLEEVVGLGKYGKTLTVLTIEDGYDEDEWREEEEMKDSWQPHF